MAKWVCPKCKKVIKSTDATIEVAHVCPSNKSKITNFEKQEKETNE